MSKVKGSNPMLTERVFKRASPQGKTMTIGGIVNEQDSSHRFPPFLLFYFSITQRHWQQLSILAHRQIFAENTPIYSVGQ